MSQEGGKMAKIQINRFSDGSTQAYIQPTTKRESRELDDLLDFKGDQINIFKNMGRADEDRSICEGYIGGHETARWIFILSKPIKIT